MNVSYGKKDFIHWQSLTWLSVCGVAADTVVVVVDFLTTLLDWCAYRIAYCFHGHVHVQAKRTNDTPGGNFIRVLYITLSSSVPLVLALPLPLSFPFCLYVSPLVFVHGSSLSLYTYHFVSKVARHLKHKKVDISSILKPKSAVSFPNLKRY